MLVTSCSDGGKTDDRPAKNEGPVTFVAGDASLPPTTINGGSASAMPSDDIDAHRPIQPQPLPARERRAIDVTLRSSPPGAGVAVDGTAVGVTPAFWSGYADGREHEFVFTLPRHAIARYRFVPISSGVIHARLDPIAEDVDAGIAPPPEVVPRPLPPAITPPPIETPADAAAAATAPPHAGSAPPPHAGSAPPPPIGSGPTVGPGPQP